METPTKAFISAISYGARTDPKKFLVLHFLTCTLPKSVSIVASNGHDLGGGGNQLIVHLCPTSPFVRKSIFNESLAFLPFPKFKFRPVYFEVCVIMHDCTCLGSRQYN